MSCDVVAAKAIPRSKRSFHIDPVPDTQPTESATFQSLWHGVEGYGLAFRALAGGHDGEADAVERNALAQGGGQPGRDMRLVLHLDRDDTATWPILERPHSCSSLHDSREHDTVCPP